MAQISEKHALREAPATQIEKSLRGPDASFSGVQKEALAC